MTLIEAADILRRHFPRDSYTTISEHVENHPHRREVQLVRYDAYATGIGHHESDTLAGAVELLLAADAILDKTIDRMIPDLEASHG